MTSSQTKNETTMTKATFVVYLLIHLFIQNANKHIVSEKYTSFGVNIKLMASVLQLE